MHKSSFNCHIGSFDVLGTSVTASCSPLPSRRSPGRVIRKRLYAQATQQRYADKNVSVNVNTPVNADRHLRRCVHGHVRVRTFQRIRACVCVRDCGQHRRICKRTPKHPWTHLQAYTQRPRQTRTIPCVKLRTVVSRYVSQLPMPLMVRLDTDPLQTQTVFLVEVKMFASACLSSAVVSIDRDGRHLLRSWPCHINNEQLMKSELACDHFIAL